MEREIKEIKKNLERIKRKWEEVKPFFMIAVGLIMVFGNIGLRYYLYDHLTIMMSTIMSLLLVIPGMLLFSIGMILYYNYG